MTTTDPSADEPDRVVLITGGGTGIGAAAAARFVAAGDRVVVIGRRPGPLQEVAARLGATAIVADSSDSAASEAAVSEVLQRFGRIDVLVANAGGHGMGDALSTTDETWNASLSGNVSSAFVIIRAALPELIRRRGQIVVVSSLAGYFAGPDVLGYTVGKHALIGLTRSLARDYGRYGVRANAVCPGWVQTPMADQEMDDFAAQAGLADRAAGYALVTKDVPLGRPAAADEIASVIHFLGSAASSYVTGASIMVDGGSHIVDLPTIALSPSV